MNKLVQQTYTAENRTYKRSLVDVGVSSAISVGALYGFNKMAGYIPTPIELKSLRFLNLQTMPYMEKGADGIMTGKIITGKPWYEALGRGPKLVNGVLTEQKATVRDLMMNAVKGAEEQLFRIPRAFSFTQMLSGGHINQQLGREAFDIHINMIRGQLGYLNKISGGKITEEVARGGMRYVDGSLISSKTGDRLLNHASLMYNKWNSASDIGKEAGTASKSFVWRMGQALQRNLGLHPTDDSFLITGGRHALQTAGRKLHAGLAVGVENFMKLMDDPFEMASKFAEKTIGGADNVPTWLKKGSKFWEKIGAKNMFGVGGWDEMRHGGGIAKLFTKHATRGLPLLGAIAIGVPLLDETIRGLGFKPGIKGAAANAYQNVTMAGARLSDVTGLTSYTKHQEKDAPGSTSIKGLAALGGSLAIGGATFGGIQNLLEKTPIGEKMAPPEFYTKGVKALEEMGNGIGSVVKGLKLGNRGRVGAYAMMGLAAGLALALPMLPGALGSEKSADELGEIYSGEQKVEVRQGQKWEFGLTPYKGGDVKYFAPHWSVRAITDAAKRTKFGKFYGKPLERMINRIADPYFLERSLDKERPYTFWSPTDYGLGFPEKLLAPIKEVFKPTIAAHPEAVGVDHPSQHQRGMGKGIPESIEDSPDAMTTQGYTSVAKAPDTKKRWAKDAISSFSSTLGLIGFSYSSMGDKLTGGQGVLNIEAEQESSGRIWSQQRAYWDQELGGMLGQNEFYRRLNPNRGYGTEYVQGAIRNTQPTWMPEEYQYGDPYSSVPQGEVRMPGRGYAELHPELKGVDYEKYPMVHRLNILHDVDRHSIEYYKAKAGVDHQMEDGELGPDGRQMYDNIMQRENLMNEDLTGHFDNGEGGARGAYWLKLKQLGRKIPTEHLFPISPVHKFMGPADALSEYKSNVLLDSPFKVWSNPVRDYVKPTYNSIMDTVTMGNFIPKEAKEHREMSGYFQKMQYAKNQLLDEKAQEYADNKDFEAASYVRSGKRPTIFNTSPYADREDLGALLDPREKPFLGAFADTKHRGSVLKAVDPAMQTMLKAQWEMSDMTDKGQFDKLSQIQRDTSSIGGDVDAHRLMEEGNVPDRDFVGYAPGVNLNAFKLKVANGQGKNIRDFNLWKEDERQARLLDTLMRGQNVSRPYLDYQTDNAKEKKQNLTNYLNKIGMNARVSISPVVGPSMVHFTGHVDNKERLHQMMQSEGYVTY